jgi:hypothetical protein
MKPQTTAEHWIWFAMIGTYAFWFVGGLYIVGAVLGWILLIVLIKQWWDRNPDVTLQLPWAVWIWVIGMGVMEIVLVIGHFDFNLDVSLIIKSSIGWAKGWALLALFPVISLLKIRPQILYRAACIVGLQTLLLFPFFVLAYLAHLPETLFVSPLKIVGGPGPEFFAVSVYEIDPGSGLPRWRLFTPWAPALGMMGNMYFFLCWREPNLTWRLIGLAGAVLMQVISASRLAIVAVVAVTLFLWLCSNWSRPLVWILAGFGSFGSGLAAPTLLSALETVQDRFRSARENSSRVREALGRIALDRWWDEAPIWGHGVVEKGPHLVEFMPIGSHHTWYGLLFVKGVVGLVALAVPMICSFLDLMLKAPTSRVSQTGLAMLLILFFYTFGENLEILSYLFWPGLVMIGLAHQESLPHAPFATVHSKHEA